MKKFVRQEDLFASDAAQTALKHKELFSEEFLAWIPYNAHVWLAFEREALKVRRRGQSHYSARTIIEYLRHNSAVRGICDEWKLNDKYTPYLARIFCIMYPEHKGFFELRQTKKAYTPQDKIYA